MAAAQALGDLPEKGIEEVAHVLAAALRADPFFRYVFPDDAQRVERLPLLVTPLVRFAYLFGDGATFGDPVEGAAVWTPPGVDITPERARAARFDLRAALEGDAMGRYGTVMDHLQPVMERDMPDPHWYLMAIGVAPGAQRRGIGSALLQPMLASADADGGSCYLHTFLEDDIGFYSALGFEVCSSGREPTSGLAWWSLKRAGTNP